MSSSMTSAPGAWALSWEKKMHAGSWECRLDPLVREFVNKWLPVYYVRFPEDSDASGHLI